MTLREIIADEIFRVGAIPFSRFMQLCLYHPQLGYYSREHEQFGRDGDFYTSSDVHAVYGRLLARQFEEMWRALRSPGRVTVVELGPGRGLFAHDVLNWAAGRFPAFATALHYVLIESSPSLHSRLQQRFADEIAAGRVSLFRSIADAPQCDAAIVFANEFFDAVPVDVISGPGQLYIESDASGGFGETWREPDEAARRFVAEFGVAPGARERVEAAPQLRALVAEIAAKFDRGFGIVVDYGYTRPELEAGLHRDTVRSFHRHRLRTNLLASPGEQDITADVNFTAIAQLARRAGLEAMPLLRQSQFLIGIGEPTQFADVFDGCMLPQEHTKRALQLKHLITPEGLGEAFKVLVLYRGVERESVQRLSGMAFTR